MGFDLSARNRSIKSFHMGAFSWHWMLNAGVGLPLRYGPGVGPGSFCYQERKDGLCIGYNDGARVTAKEAKEMARLARWIADYQDTLLEVYQKESVDRQRKIESDRTGIYTLPTRRDFVQLARDFADWAEKSGGFTVH